MFFDGRGIQCSLDRPHGRVLLLDAASSRIGGVEFQERLRKSE